MAGHHPWSTIRDKMSPERRAKIEAGVVEMQRDMLLSELRKHSGLTQKELADRLGISQAGLSKMEGQENMEIVTLNRLVNSLGGHLELIVHMPDGDVSLSQFASE